MRSRVAGPVIVLAASLGGCVVTGDLGADFQNLGVVGEARPGDAHFDGESGYRITGSGGNIWGTRDAFQFLWSERTGDLRLEADVRFPEPGGDPHRKAGWMIRGSLAADAPYVDAVVHGDGLVAMQFRRTPGGETEEIRAWNGAGSRVVLERTADVYTMSVVDEQGVAGPVGSIRLALPETVLAGLFVCAHDAERFETAEFTGVSVRQRVAGPNEQRVVESTLEIYDLETGRRAVVYRAEAHFEAPNWSRDGSYLLFNQQGRLYTLPVEGGTPALLDTGFADRCNNDHGFSPDGRWLATSHSPENQSLIYVMPAAGGTPRLVTEKGPSYWHGWSPDGRMLAYCAERNGEYDVYVIPAEGGTEVRLTDAPGLDDGPDYSPDGRWIYFNSVRTGLMKIWRISPDGKQAEQVTHDDVYADWFPHPSPDGSQLVWLSYDRTVEGHPPNQEVVLRRMGPSETQPQVIVHLFGGQGTLNVPSWSPDSRRFAFVSYRQILPEWGTGTEGPVSGSGPRP
jgi:TolB protein